VRIRHVLSVVGVATLAACGGEGVGPEAAPALFDQDVALFAAEGAGQDVELMRGPGGRFGLGLPADAGSFECGTFDRHGMTITRTCEFFDATGAPQTAYDAEATDSVVMHTEVSGSLDRGSWGGAVERVNDVTVSGLAGTETSVVWNGTGSGTMSRIRQTRDGGEAQFEMAGTHSVTDLEIPVPRAEDGWPLGGTINSFVTVTITGGERDGTTHERDVTITFDGSQFATVQVGDETFTVDLANRQHHGFGRRGPGQR
jgi:hypothetical protein